MNEQRLMMTYNVVVQALGEDGSPQAIRHTATLSINLHSTTLCRNLFASPRQPALTIVNFDCTTTLTLVLAVKDINALNVDTAPATDEALALVDEVAHRMSLSGVEAFRGGNRVGPSLARTGLSCGNGEAGTSNGENGGEECGGVHLDS